MDSSYYKDFKTSRGYTYHYLSIAPENDKPYLVLLHGFPTSSSDWVHVVTSLRKEGYGFIVPDLLGYAGTDKPTDPKEYRFKLMAADIIEILDVENVKKAIAVAHDWGCGLNSRLINYYQDRFEAFAFFAIAYFPPTPGKFDLDAINDMAEKVLGYRYLGYWKFFEREDAAKILEDHMESFASLAFAKDPKVLRDNFCEEGQLIKWLMADMKTEIASFIPKEAIQPGNALLKNGFEAPLCWYKAVLQGYNPKDDADIPQESYIIKKPVFFGATLQDPTGPPQFTKPTMAAFAPKLTVVDFDTGHWVLDEAPEKVNTELLKWLNSLGY